MSEVDEFAVLQELNALKSHFDKEQSELNGFSSYLDRHHNQYLEELRVRNDQHGKSVQQLQDLRVLLDSVSASAASRGEAARRSSAARLEERLDELNGRLAAVVGAREAKVQEGLSQLSALQEVRMTSWKFQLSDRKSEHGKLEEKRRQLVARLKNLEEISDSLKEQLRLTRLARPDEKIRFERETRELLEAVAVGNRRIETLETCRLANIQLESEISSNKQEISDLQSEITTLTTDLTQQLRRNQDLEVAAIHTRQLRREARNFRPSPNQRPASAPSVRRLSPARVAALILTKTKVPISGQVPRATK